MEGEEDYLRREIERLRVEVEAAPRPSSRILPPESKDWTIEKLRRALMHQLEQAEHRLAAVQETKRVETVIRQAVESGFVVVPAYGNPSGKGECPLCQNEFLDYCEMENGDHHYIFPCCGTRCCWPCRLTFDEMRHMAKEALQAKTAATLTGDETKKLERMKECPCCHNDYTSPEMKGSYNDILLRQAKAGKDWAQYEIARLFYPGDTGLGTERQKAAHWYKLAADQGNVMAATYVLILSEEGVRADSSVSANKKDHHLYLARHGDRMAQLQLAYDEDTSDEDSVIWCTLSAAQTHAPGETLMASLCFKGIGGMAPSIFKSTYWLRRAAQQGLAEAQSKLSEHVLRSRAAIFEVPDLVGYNALPESVFWFELATKDPEFALMLQGRQPPYFEFDKCSNCNMSASNRVTLKRCVQCKGVAYCGRECQSLHWKLGHKVDCKSADHWKQVMKAKDAGKKKDFASTDNGKSTKRLQQLHDMRNQFPNFSYLDFNEARQSAKGIATKNTKKAATIVMKKDGTFVVHTV